MTEQKIYVVYRQDDAYNLMAFRTEQDAIEWVERQENPDDYGIDSLVFV